uniref:Centromere protein F n=1 Tax=Felis catus TaxID=9685 RepID=A0ABI7WC29_FELCA
MSWALEEWKEGLPTRALQKIQELEGQLDKLKKERQQRQFQLETLEAALQKQKQKVEHEKTEGANLKRENQSLMEVCENLEKTKQKISHELQVKESQVNFQEGQLNSSKKQIEKLEQELKRCKSELERSHQAAQSADASLHPCTTPQKIFATPLTPSQHYSGSKYEDLKEKYNKEVEERKRLEAEVKALQAKKVSQAIPQSTMNHRDIARHQTSSSVFSWQQEKTPSRLPSGALKTPIRRDFSASPFFGEQEMTPSRSTLQTGKRDASNSFCDNSSNSHLLDQLKAQNQELRSKISDLELRLQGQEKETKGHASKCQELQLQLEKAKVELMEKEKVLNKNRDELVRMTAQYDQASTKCAALEQKLRRLSEDLSCQRQNADSARCSLEQKIKEKEKEFQEELGRQQRACQALDQECTQMKARLTQELQQAKNTHNILQADLDKVTSVRHQLEKNLEEFKQKFCRTEQALQASQMQENELRRSSEEAKKENSLLKSQSEQRAREACHLEEELRKAKQSLSQSQNFAEEMRAKNASQETMLRDLQEKINQQENSLTLEKLKLALADLEKQRDCSQDLLKKREHHIEQLNDKLSKMEKESEALLIALELKKKEYEELKEEETLFARWKSEKEQLLSQLESEKGSLQSKLHHLETCLKTQQIKSHEYNEKVRTLEMESENLNVEIRNLHNVIDSKTVEVETHKQAYVELQQKAELSDQKHKKEVENMCLKISQLTRQVEDLEHKLQLVSSEVTDRDQRYQDLHAEYESLQDLLKSKDASLVTNEAHQGSLLAFEQQSAMNNSFANILGEQRSTPSGRSKCQLEADHSPKSSASLQNRVISLEFSLESQKQMNSDLQKQCEELVQIRGEIEDNLIKAEQMHQSFVAETSQRISKLQEDTSVHQNVFAETLVALENKEREFQLLNEKLETEQAEIQELKKSNHLLQESLKELQLLSESLSSEKKEMSAAISLNRKEIEELTQENETLKEINATLSQEKTNLLQKSESFLNCIDERDKSISELSNQYQQERLILLQRCEETGRALEDLSEKYKAAQEKNSELECLLSECTRACENREHELEHLKEAFAMEHQAFVTKLALAEERNQNLILELGAVQQDLRSEIADIQNNSKSEADGLKQEIMTLKEEQSKMQKELNALLQEKEHLLTLTEMKQEHQILESEPISDSMKGESDINECHVQLPMDLQVEDPPLDCYNAQLVQSGAKMRRREFQLQESEKEKECLQTIRVELDTGNVQRDTQSQELSGPEDCAVDTEGKYVSGLHEFSSQNDNAHLQCSLQTAMSKLSELEKMCETLQVEKLELISELNDSRSECITAASKMAEEVEKLVNEVKILNDEHGLLQGELVKETAEGELGERQNEQKCASLNPLNDSNCYEHLTLSNKELQMHFAELQEKLSSLQSEHKILHDQHCQMSSKMSDLQSYVDTLKAENSVLSTSLRNFQGDLVKEEMPGPQEGHFLSLSFSRMTDSPGLTSLGESSFCKDLLDQTGETSLLNNLVGNLSANQCNVEEGSCCSLEEENLTKKEILSTPVKSVEELEILCQMYLQSLKKLEDKIESQEIMKNKEIEELEQLLSSERKELDCLKKQYLSENEQWQQKLTSVTVEMESKLAAEKKQTEHLSLELEVARLQLQGLDLSSRSLLCTDIEDLQALRGGNDSCDIKESEECTLETKESTPKLDTHKMCENGVQQDLNLEMEKIAETGAAQFTGEWSREQSTETSYETPVEDKTPGCSERISQLSFSDPNALVPMDFLENQVSIQNLQLQVRETSNENLRLLHIVEQRDKKVESLLNEIKELDSKLDLQEAQLTTKTEACIELEKIVEELKKEKSNLSERLGSFSCDNQELHQRAESLEVLSSNLEVGTDKFSREVIEDNVAKVNNWRERFLDVENELKRIESEKGSIEHHALSVEAALETVQTEKLYLEQDSENKQKVIARLEEELSVVTSERNQLRGELDTLSKENKELDLMSEKMKQKIQELESHQGECLQPPDVAGAEVKDQTHVLQTLPSNISELLEENARLQEQLQSLEKDSQALSLVKGELEIQIEQLNEEKESLVRESESLQTRLNESEHEKLAVAKSLENALMEKGEVAVRLSSTQEEVHQLRKGIEKLRVRIEADEKKQLHVLEKLRASERKTDSLQDKVENLERELQMSEENQELVILDAENSKAEVGTLKAKIEEMAQNLRDLELDLVHMRSEKENVTKELQKEQGRVSELEILNSSFENLLQEKEQEKVQMREDSKIVVETLQTQLKELTEKVAALYCDQDTWKAQEQNLSRQIDALEHEKAQLLQGLDEVKSSYVSLQSSANGLIQQVEDGKRKLEKKDEEISNLKSQIQDREQLISKLSQVEGEQQLWKKQKGELEDVMVDLEQKVQMLQSKNDTLQDTLETLQHSYKALEKELELTKMENVSFVEKVNTMTGKETELQREMHEMAQKTAELKEEFIGEKNRLTGELTVMSEEIKSSQGQLRELMLENSELKKNLDCAHKDQMEKEEKTREEIAEYQLRLQEAEKKHQALLLDTNKQYEMEIQTYREKLTSSEECLCSQKAEMELLKSSKEELNNSLKAATQMLEELKKTKADRVKYTDQLKKENERSQGKIKLLIKSCKQLEEEKEMLQKELSHLEGTQEKQKTGAVVDSNVEELMAEIKQLKETLEEKSQEADEYLDKYCSLLISHEKLEKAKEMLETQVARLCSQSKLNLQSSPLLNAVVPESSPAPSATEKKLSSSQNKAPGKRQRSIGIPEDGGGAAPSTPETFSKKSRKASKSGIHPSEDAKHTEFEPEGLPEVVKKGFADIPTGKTSPYVLRRTTMPTRTSPRLAAQKLTPSPLSLNKENHTETSKPTAGGSRSQKVKVAQQSPMDSGATFREPTTRSLSVSNLPERSSADSPREGLRAKRGRLAPSPEAIPESKSSENCRVQ